MLYFDKRNKINSIKMTKLLLSEESCYNDYLNLVNKMNLCLLLKTSNVFFIKKLRHLSMSLLKRNFVSISKTNEFKEIDYNLFRLLISSSEINVSSEIEVFQTIVSWIQYNKTFREVFMFDLLKFVRLPLLTSEIIKNVIRNHPFCSKRENCYNHIDFVLLNKSKSTGSYLAKATKSTLGSYQYENRYCMHEKVAFMFYEQNSSSYTKRDKIVCELNNDFNFEPMKNSNNILEFQNSKFYLQDSTISYEKYYIQYLSKNSKEWRKIFPDVEYVESYAICIFIGKLYILGGRCYAPGNLGYEINDCRVFDPVEEKKTKICSMQQYRCDHSCAVFQGKIVVTGGVEHIENSVEAYDYYLDKWTYMPDLTELKNGHGSVAIGNKLYAIGGLYTKNCEVFDSISNKFTRIKQLKRIFYYKELEEIEIFSVKEKIVVKLDRVENAEEDNVYIYNTTTNKWTSTCVDIFKGPQRSSIIYTL